MRCEAVDRHNMMGQTGFRVEELKFRTFVFQFLGLVCTQAWYPGLGGQRPDIDTVSILNIKYVFLNVIVI